MPAALKDAHVSDLRAGIARKGLPEDVEEKEDERPEGNVSGNIAANLHLLFDSEAIFHTPSVSAAMVAQTRADRSVA
jgi:hypothetical protein